MKKINLKKIRNILAGIMIVIAVFNASLYILILVRDPERASPLSFDLRTLRLGEHSDSSPISCEKPDRVWVETDDDLVFTNAAYVVRWEPMQPKNCPIVLYLHHDSLELISSEGYGSGSFLWQPTSEITPGENYSIILVQPDIGDIVESKNFTIRNPDSTWAINFDGNLLVGGQTYEIELGELLDDFETIEISLYKNGYKVREIYLGPYTNIVQWSVDPRLPSGSNYYFLASSMISEKYAKSREFEINNSSSEWVVHVLADMGGGPDGVRFYDVNQDGLQDIVTAFESSGNITLFLNPGLDNVKQEWPYVIVGNVPRGEDAFALDLDNDGAVDIVSSHEGDTLGVYVHWGVEDNIQSWSTERIQSSQGRAWMYAISMDVNEDGHTDIVAGSKDDFYNERNAVGIIGWFESPAENKRDLNNWVFHAIDHVGWTMSIIPYDVDHDGDLDLVLTDRNADEAHQGVRWLENPGNNWENEWNSYFIDGLSGTRPVFMAISNVDQIKGDEYIVPLESRGKIVIVRNISKDTGFPEFQPFEIQFDFANGYGTLKGVELADIDLDGTSDIIVAFEGGKVGIGWLSFEDDPYNGSWEWRDIHVSEGGKFDQVLLYDMDGDGDLDIITTEELVEKGVFWYENPTIIED